MVVAAREEGDEEDEGVGEDAEKGGREEEG